MIASISLDQSSGLKWRGLATYCDIDTYDLAKLQHCDILGRNVAANPGVAAAGTLISTLSLAELRREQKLDKADLTLRVNCLEAKLAELGAAPECLEARISAVELALCKSSGHSDLLSCFPASASGERSCDDHFNQRFKEALDICSHGACENGRPGLASVVDDISIPVCQPFDKAFTVCSHGASDRGMIATASVLGGARAACESSAPTDVSEGWFSDNCQGHEPEAEVPADMEQFFIGDQVHAAAQAAPETRETGVQTCGFHIGDVDGSSALPDYVRQGSGDSGAQPLACDN